MSKNQYTEVKAIEITDEYLGSLADDNARMRVINWICQKYLNNPVYQGVLNPPTGLGGGQQLTDQLSNFKGFMDSKKPKDGYQKLACLAYFLEKKKRLSDFNVKDLRSSNTEAKQTTISNISVYLENATAKYGYFTSTAKGRKCLTSRGEAVVDALPDQEKVKQALMEHKFRTKTKRKGKAKKS